MTKQFLSPSAVFPSTVYTVIMVITQPFKLQHKQIQSVLKKKTKKNIYIYLYICHVKVLMTAAFNHVISQIYNEVPRQTLPVLIYLSHNDFADVQKCLDIK